MANYNHLIGKILDGRYRLVKYIAGGGQANVWQATDLESGVPRAIKLFEARLNTPPEDIERFKKESLLLVNMPTHKNVIQIYDGGFDAALRVFYIVMELVDGVTLHDFIAVRDQGNGVHDEGNGVHDEDNGGREATEVHVAESDDEETGVHVIEPDRLFPPAIAVAIVSQTAQALDHVHQYNIVHRDVKPGNILIGRDGVVKLTDLGIARLTEDSGLTETDKAVGTLYYMSPEQIQGLKVDGRTDIYSLGVVLYECLVGRTPFGKASRDMIPYHIIHTPPTPPTELNSEVPASLEAAIMHTLAKAPEDRYRRMAEFEGALAGLTDTGVLPAVSEGQISTGVLTIRGDAQSDGSEQPPEKVLDSDQRCMACGAPLPIGWPTTLTECPGCGGSLAQVGARPTEKVLDFIRQARERRQFPPGKIAFDMAMFLYTMELQSPTFQEWQTKTAETEPELQKGTVLIPTPINENLKGAELVVAARRLMDIADFLTDPELNEYNKRWPELREVEALAAHARAKAYQLLGRYHTLQGSVTRQSEAATKKYEQAFKSFGLAGRQYRLANNAWRQYEAGEPSERIQGYYAPVMQEARQREQWAAAAESLTQGILRFPHNHTDSYGSFHKAVELGQELPPTPGITNDLNGAELYIGYYEKAEDDRKNHLTAIDAAQTDAHHTIAAAHKADAALVAEDRQYVTDWLHERSRIALDYFNKRENLPHQLRRIRLTTWAVGYLMAVILMVAFIGEARHAAYTVTNPGPFWPGWPMILAQFRRYAADFGSWHHFLVMLIGIDLLIFWPFNLMAARQTPRVDRSKGMRPIVPTLSRLLIPLVDGLDAIVQRGMAQGDETPERPTNKLFHTLARLTFAVAPWVPVFLLTWALRSAFGGLGLPGNYVTWLAALFILPPLAGRFVGRVMRRLGEKLDRMEADEKEAQGTLDRKILIERERIGTERARQAQTVHDAFAHANDEHDSHRATIKAGLEVFLARLLYYKQESDFVDLPEVKQTLLKWREAIDQAYLRPMGLKYDEKETSAVDTPEWRAERPLNLLTVTTSMRPIPLRFVHDQAGYVLWGINGFQKCRRQPLQKEADGYSAEVKLPPQDEAQQVNFTFETSDHRWPGQAHTIWLESGNRVE